MTVVIVTNGNLFSSVALRRVLADDSIAYHVFVTTGLRRPKRRRSAEAARLLRVWGVRYASYKVATYAVPAIGSVLARQPLTVLDYCRKRGIPCDVVRNVNDRDAVSRIERLEPDLLVSYSCPYRIRSQLLSVPRIGSVNVHSSLLPAYAGVCTYIHVLANGETETGVTVHEMVEEFDAGRLLAQERIAITPGMSVAELFARQSDLGGRLLHDVIKRSLTQRALSGTAQDLSQRSYFGEPTKENVRRLRRRGHRLLHPHDYRFLLTGRLLTARL
ncbi:MAG: methionyl-tRNA formyltransferase [Gammaproteobacteria bacterium]